jgi:alpha-amylase
LERLGKREVWHPFIRAGIWDNFLVKYSESNLMHKRMLWASHGLQGAGEGALRELYRGQCNCAYWHGLFGGLYLKHLRQAVYHHLILAERLHEASRPAGWCNLARCDYDRDGRDEIVVANADLFACLAPESGGCLLELDYKPRAVNLTDTLTRRKEAYHRGLLERHKPEEASAGGGGQPLSIHERMGSKEEGLDKLLVYDTYDRRSFLDHLLAEDATPDSLRGPEYAQGGVEEGDFIGAPYTVAQQAAGPEGAGGATVRLERVGSLRRGAQTHPVRVAKTFNFGAGSELVVDYEVGPVGPAVDPAEGPLPARFAVELNLSPVGDSDDAVYYVVEGEKHPGGQSVEAASVGRVALIDERLDYRIEVGVEPRATAWLWPLETVSQSDEGFERNRQGTVLLLSWTVDLQARQSFRVRLLAAPAR